MYTHAYIDENVSIFGFGDGQFSFFDIRNEKSFFQYKDKTQHYIGDILFSNGTLINLGSGVSIYKFNQSSLNLFGSYTQNKLLGQKCSGSFFKGNKYLGVTDTVGNFSFYDTNKFNV